MKILPLIKPGPALLLLLLSVHNLPGQIAPQAGAVDLRQASLEDLMDIKVTSVSKREEKLSRAAAAIFVISQEDIRRSGATNIPDALRMAPGVDVEQIDANSWAISIRGFNSRFANKVLVLIDGRTVYNPVFLGVFWDMLEMPLEDIERIEVIRGPGATVWGANAVNGVISIITKSSKKTKGGLVAVGGGSQTHATTLLQYGADAGENATYRVFGDYFNIGNSASKGHGAANDRWQRSHAGFRADWEISAADSLSAQGDLFANQDNQTTNSELLPNKSPYNRIFPQTLDSTGGDLLARWTHTLENGSQTSLQGYYNSYRRTDLGAPSKSTTFDLDFQHHLTAGDRNDIVWGLGYRNDRSGTTPGYAFGFAPPFRTVSLVNVFLQDEIKLTDSLWFTIGAKLEHNAFTGFEFEPNLRIVWAPPASRHTVWASASKAIRQPARADTDVQATIQMFPVSASALAVVHVVGNPNTKAEELREYELGYRSEISRTLSLDAASFLSFYHHLETIESQTPHFVPGSPLIIDIPALYRNQAHGMDYGGEIFLTWKADTRWRISPGYSYLHAALRPDALTTGRIVAVLATDFPSNVLQIRSLINLSRTIEFDQSLYYTARLPGGSIPGHTRLDLRLARQIGESTEISLVGQNLLRPRTLEYGDALGVVGAQSVRSVYAKVTWRF